MLRNMLKTALAARAAALGTPLPGVVWCNCPHMANYDGLKVADRCEQAVHSVANNRGYAARLS